MLGVRSMVALAATLCLVGCSDDTFHDLSPDEDEAQDSKVTLCLRVRMSDSGVPASRADGTPANETPGTDRENVVGAMLLLVYDADDNRLIDYVDLSGSQIEAMQSSPGLVVPVGARKGQRVYIYAVANPTEGMRLALSPTDEGKDVAYVSPYTDYRDVMDALVPGSGGHQTELEASADGSIPMTGVFRVGESGTGNIITIPDGDNTEEDPLTVTAEMSRIVAKMHVLAMSETDATGSSDVAYVPAKDRTAPADTGDDSARIGWIRLSDVRYMPNGINRSTYIFPHFNSAGNPMDCNMNLTGYDSGGYFNNSLYNKEFVYYGGVSLHQANVINPGYFSQAEEFDQTRLDKTNDNSNSPDRYTRGMYCPENYFDIPTSNGSFFAGYDGAIPMVTHLSVAARLTPCNIVVLKDYASMMDNFVAQYEANPDKFCETYSLTADDFTDADVSRWMAIKERYFSAGVLPDVYRDDYRIIKTHNESDAADIIKWSLMANRLWSGSDADFENGKYPAGTFHVYDTHHDGVATAEVVYTQRYLYLTAGAVNKASGANMKIKTYSVPHVGGWGYYYTYLDQLGQTSGYVTPYTSSQVTRNTYYLVTVRSFGSPGGTITRPEYIKVNTKSVDWVYDGVGDINLY